MDAAVAALLGVAVTSAASIVTLWTRERSERRRERIRLAVQAGIEDHKQAMEMAKLHDSVTEVAPLSGFIHYHAHVLDLLERNQMTPDNLRTLAAEQERLYEVAREVLAGKISK
jgi:hypothetical protein